MIARAFGRNVIGRADGRTAQFIRVTLRAQIVEVRGRVVFVLADTVEAGKGVVVAEGGLARIAVRQDARVHGVIVVAEHRGGVPPAFHKPGEVVFGVNERRHIINRARGAEVPAREDGHAARPARRGLAEETVEEQAFGGEGVEVGRLNDRVARRAETVPPELVGDNEEDVSTLRHSRTAPSSARDGEEGG